MTRTDELSPIFLALADPHRRAILGWLRQGGMTVGALVARLPLSQPGVTKHLGVLERAGLIRRRAEGRRRICELEAAGLARVDAWLSGQRAFWDGALERLAEIAENQDNLEETSDDARNERADRGR